MSNATNPLVVTIALANKVNEANIPNKDKCGFTCVTSKIFKKTKHKPAKPRTHETKIETGKRLDNLVVVSIITIIGEKHIPANKYEEKL